MAYELQDMQTYIEEGKVADFQDHHYSSEMSVDAMIQAYLLDGSADDARSRFLAV